MHAVRNGAPEEAPTTVKLRVIDTTAPLQLARLVGRRDGLWELELGGDVRSVEAASDVDPRLLEEVLERGGRVLVESTQAGEFQIAGVVQTQRAVTVNTDDEVDVEVRSFRVRAHRELLFSTTQAFVQVKRGDIEFYGGEVLTRARDVARILGRLISLN